MRCVTQGSRAVLDNLHILAPGDFSGGADEFCFCNIRRQR